MQRRKFIDQSFKAVTLFGITGIWACKENNKAPVSGNEPAKDPLFKISLSEWSFHRSIRSGKMDHLDLAHEAGKLDIRAVEYVTTFFQDKAKDLQYLKEMDMRAKGEFVKSVLIMVDGEGDLANTIPSEGMKAIDDHKKWVEAAGHLGCHAIRVNAFGIEYDRESARLATIDNLSKLVEFAKPYNINVLLENHAGHSADAKWTHSVIKEIGMDNCGTLADFSNFCIRREGGDLWSTPCIESYDPYLGMAELMPFAKGVSAKSFEFDESGHTSIDYDRILKIVTQAGYNGYIGIEYEGSDDDERSGIFKTKLLLDNFMKENSKF